MRSTVFLAVVLSLCNCSLIGTRRPDPPPYEKVPDCNDGITRPVLDTIFGGGGLAMIGLGVIDVANPTVAVDGTKNYGGGAALLTFGVAVAGLFVTSAIIGYPRVNACRDARAQWFSEHPEDKLIASTQTGETIDVQVVTAARRALQCPTEPLERVPLSFSRNDFHADPYRWAGRHGELRGCGRVTWCGEHDDEQVFCEPPADQKIALQRVAAETGCPPESIITLQRSVMTQEGRRGADGLSTLRFNACGEVLACNVPLSVPDKGDTLLPNLDNGANFSCRSIGRAAPEQPALPPPPAPPPSQP